MKILITFDYELFFGSSTGSQYRCMIRPTESLIKIAEKHNVRFSYFADCGYIVKLQEYMGNDVSLRDDFKDINVQLKYLADQGNDVQLHIHPHWEDCIFKDHRWVLNTTRYRLHQFDTAEIKHIFTKYSEALYHITGQKLHTFRAGGWCLQPFDKLRDCFINTGLKADSSVFREGFEESQHYYYNYRNCPKKDWWKFDNDPVMENSNGRFIEVPIASMLVSPLFYWWLYFLGRMNPSYHKPLGDGKPILSKGYKKRILTRYTRQVVSTDGYNARLLQYHTDKQSRENNAGTLVILGHPKALSPYSLKTLDTYITKNKDTHQFITYSDFLKNK